VDAAGAYLAGVKIGQSLAEHDSGEVTPWSGWWSMGFEDKAGEQNKAAGCGGW
jgi:hypothetical protein